MLSVAAAQLGIKTHIYEPAANPPAQDVAAKVFTAAYDNNEALKEFANSVDVITYEFENIPAKTLEILEKITPVLPEKIALATSQDRAVEKRFLQKLGLSVAPFAEVNSLKDLNAAFAAFGTSAILKTRRFGYDGKGQVKITAPGQTEDAFISLNGAPAILEGFVDFEREISVIAARNKHGKVSCFDPGENIHRDGILYSTTVPANLSHTMETDAILLAARILNALDYVGVMGVELFVTKGGLVVNEIAPRVHNSGHWTQDACLIDQFQQHIRAICGWPLGDGMRHSNATMVNLIGEDVSHLNKNDGTGIHLYGKKDIKPGRKMGHYNRISPKTA
ncbi:MAG: 5-(carboxyamino)imidazole ribonucleotide synthase [Rhodobacteraceae bacterium]|nr:5-(carboxyamino)imidazole ribonucleotide synthase [Paracoccaceae bacterium]